jgi:hypothetical protein
MRRDVNVQDAPPIMTDNEEHAERNRWQGRKLTALVLGWLRIRRFDPIAEASELPDHPAAARGVSL